MNRGATLVILPLLLEGSLHQ